MSGFGDPVGRAIMEAEDPPNAKRIPDLEFTFVVTGKTLGDLGRAAGRAASTFYEGTPWEFVSMSAERVDIPSNYYSATVWTRAT